jgi:trehalose synthase
MRRVNLDAQDRLAVHEEVAHLATAVAELRAESEHIKRHAENRTLWMVNSTEKGGGVAEMLPTIVALLRDLGIATEWAVLESDDPAFFDLTKRLHNMIHGAGEAGLDGSDRELYERVNRENARQFARMLKPGDVVIVHDPQPMALGGYVRELVDVHAFWRCHIGLDEENAATRDAWAFLEPYADPYLHAIFSAPEYIPPYLAGRATVIYPAINPLSLKNRPLHLRQVVEVLSNAQLASVPGPVVPPAFEHGAERLQPNGTFAQATFPEDFGLLNRPIITQISRWDYLKGFVPLLRAFADMKQRLAKNGNEGLTPAQARRLRLSRLVLAGPDPASVADDPEATSVLDELTQIYAGLAPSVQDDIGVITLPMADTNQNALMVNVLQRCSTVVVQNSLREGFGLTISEAMWKAVPVLSNTRACGPRQQVRDGLDGVLVEDPEDADQLREAIVSMLADTHRLDLWGNSAQRRVHRDFMVYRQLANWMRLVPTFI